MSIREICDMPVSNTLASKSQHGDGIGAMTVHHPDTRTTRPHGRTGRGMRTSRAAGVVLVAITVAACGGVCGAGTAIAASAEVTLQYQCSLSPFPAQAMTARLTWNAPDSVPAGQIAPVVPVDATATLGAIITQALGFDGAATVEGTATVMGVLAAPDGNTTITRPLTVSRTAVPASGPITVAATGTTMPGFVFHRPGRATVTAGTVFTVHMILKNASGGSPMVGQADASCTLDPGQNTVLASFEITAPPTAPIPPTGGQAGPPRGGAAGSPGAGSPGAAGPTAATGGATASGTLAPGGSTTSRTPSAALGSAVPGTTDTTALGSAVTATASTHNLLAAEYPRLASGVILVAGAGVLGCVWLLRRRRRRGVRGR
jgi:hypothetical protein